MLLREGQYVPLTPKAFQTLLVLVEHGGRIVEKQDLLKEVWPDTFVEDVSIAKNVSVLRKVLGESESQRFIETVPKRGYRFVPEIKLLDGPEIVPTPVAIPAVEPNEPIFADAGNKRVVFPDARLFRWAVIVLLVIGLGVELQRTLAGRLPGAPNLKTVPLTSFVGHQTQAAFSPDGRSIAFVWEGSGAVNHVYVKPVDSESVQQITKGPGADSRPAWSPDGRTMAFLRVEDGHSAWYLVPATGGEPRKVGETNTVSDLGNANSSYFSPDGRSLAIVDRKRKEDPLAIVLLSLETGRKSVLTEPPLGSLGDYYPAFSPDGKRMAFARAASFSAMDVYLLSLSTHALTRLTTDGLPVEGLTWTSDGNSLVFSSRRAGSIDSLWKISAKGGVPERIGANSEDLVSPAISRFGNRLAYTRSADDINIWRMDLNGAGEVAGQKPLIASTFRDSDPDYSPDGKRVAFVSGRAGSFGIWICNSDGSDPKLLFDGGAYVTGSPRWSPDGLSIAFDSRSHDPATAGKPSIGVIRAEGGPVRHLTTPGEGGVAPSWSRDGRWIYFASNRSGSLEVWKIPSEGGRATQITRNGGFEAFESPDGRYLYYLKGRAVEGIWRVPVDGGEEVEFLRGNGAGKWRCWRVSERGIYYARPDEGPGLRLEFFDFASGQTQSSGRIARAAERTIPSLAVAPDGKSLLYAQYDQSGSNILMLEGMR